MTSDQGRDKGEKRGRRGIKRGAYSRDWDIARDELRMLTLLLDDPSRKVTTDDIVEDLAKKIEGGGKWRGSVPRRLSEAGAIRFVRYVKSSRPSRNSGTTGEWELDNHGTAKRLRDGLAACFVANPMRPTDDEKQKGESAGTDSPTNQTTNSDEGSSCNG